MTDYEDKNAPNRFGEDDSVEKILKFSAKFEPVDSMPSALIFDALSSRRPNRSPRIALIFVGALCVAIIAFCFTTVRKAPSVAQRSKEIAGFNSRKETFAKSELQNGNPFSMIDSLAFNSIEAELSSISPAKKSLIVGGHRRRLARRRLSSMRRPTSKIALGEAKPPQHLKTYAAMWKTETVERNYSGVLATTLIAIQDEQDRKDGTFTLAPAIIDIPLKPGDTITTTLETQTAEVSTANYKEEKPE